MKRLVQNLISRIREVFSKKPMPPVSIVIKDDHPATKMVVWPTGPVYVCDKHAEQLIKLGRTLGTSVTVSDVDGSHQCTNCSGGV